MITLLTAGAWIMLVVWIPVLSAESSSVKIHAAKPMPADETPGARPYEMVTLTA